MRKETLLPMVTTIAVLILIVLFTVMKAEIDERDAFLCTAVSSHPDLQMSDCPVHTGNLSWYLTASFALLFLLLAISILPYIQELTEPRKKPPKISGDELRIHNLLTEHEGSMMQSEIVKQTGLSKVKVTRVLDNLEGKGLLERRRRGMTNVVILR